MSEQKTYAPFPIPVIADLSLIGPGSQEDDGLDYMTMPQGMQTYQPTILPEPEELKQHQGAVNTLNAIVGMLEKQVAGEVVPPMSLLHLNEKEITLINQILGEGEVAATIEGAPTVEIQETIFVGVWRVIAHHENVKVYDAIEVGAVPKVLIETAQKDAQIERTQPPVPLPENLLNVPTIIYEVMEQSQVWQVGSEPHTVNLTLLPLSEIDIAFIDDQLGTGRVVILSRGYGNCRITNTCTPQTWRLVFYNSQDNVILNSIEVSQIPEVACAAERDFSDSLERLREVLAWLEQDA